MSDPKTAAEFVRSLIVGDAAYDRANPKHMIAMGAVRRYLKHYDLLAEAIPGLAKKIDGLDLDSEDKIALHADLIKVLTEVVAAHLPEPAAPVAAAPAAAASESPEGYALDWGDAGAEEYEGVVAIDVGTTNVVCAHWNYQAGDPIVSSYEPVAVNVLDARSFEKLAQGSYLTGKEALGHKRRMNLYQSFRRFLGTQQRTRPAITGSHMTQVRIPTLMTAAIKELLEALIRQTGRMGVRFPKVVVTVPAAGDIAFEDELRRIFESLRLPGSAELDETTAAGVYHLLHPLLMREHVQEGITPLEWYAKHLDLKVEEQTGTMHLLCIDFGGGTTDLSLLKFTVEQDRRTCRIHIEVVDTFGFMDLSGEGLTLQLFDLLKRRLALAIVDPARALTGQAGTPIAEHPWRELHEHEADSSDLYRLKEILPGDIQSLVANWGQVASNHPIGPELREAVERMFPTRYKDAPKTTLKFRRGNFRFLWSEAERLKRQIAKLRADQELSAFGAAADDDPGARYRARLDLKACPPAPRGGIHPDERIREAGLDPTAPGDPDALAVDSADVDSFVARRGKDRLVTAIRRMAAGVEISRTLLAGNGAHDTRFAVRQFLKDELQLEGDKIDFTSEEAKTAVAKGACLWAVGNRLEGVQVTLARRPRHPNSIVLVSALEQIELFQEGEPINRFCYWQPPPREGDSGEKLIQIDRRVANRLQPFLMFNPQKGVAIKPIAEYPIAQRPDVLVPDVDRFMSIEQDGGKAAYQVADAAQYTQLESGDWVSEWEIGEKLREEMTMEEAVAWIEGSAPLQSEPPEGHAFHRYYMDGNRQLYLLFHARGERLLCRGELTEQARKQLPEELDPFSGVH